MKSDLVSYGGSRYSLSDLARYMDDDSREPFTTGDQTAQAWWDEYVRRYPQDAAHAAECAPNLGNVMIP